MKLNATILNLGIVVALLAIVNSADPAGPKPFEKLNLSADDLIAATGLNIYKFRVHVPDGKKFRVVLRERSDKDAPAKVIHQYAFQKDEKATLVVMRVSFLRRDRKLAGVLLSQEDEAEYRIDCSDCSPGGIATIVSLPLGHVRPTEKVLFVHRSQKDMQEWGVNEQRLMTIVASEPGKPASPPTTFPRAELVIEKDD